MASRILGLAEMMNYPEVIAKEQEVLQKIEDAHRNGKVVDGHAPLLSGKDLDTYLSAGIQSDHECSSYEEGAERIRKGQWLMIRQGTAARNLKGLIELFEEPWSRKCLLVTDDRHPADILKDGHMEYIREDNLERNYTDFDEQYRAYIGEHTDFIFRDWQRYGELLNLLESDRLAKDISRLKGRDREILFARVYGELTFAQLGERFHMEPKQAEMAYYYVLRKLRKEMNGNGGF